MTRLDAGSCPRQNRHPQFLLYSSELRKGCASARSFRKGKGSSPYQLMTSQDGAHTESRVPLCWKCQTFLQLFKGCLRSPLEVITAGAASGAMNSVCLACQLSAYPRMLS